MSEMFAYCSELTSIDDSHFGNLILFACEMFQGCEKLSTIPMSLIDSLQICVSTNNMFDGCFALKWLPGTALSFSRIRDMSCMFRECLSMDIPPAMIDVGSVRETVDFAEMFHGCSNMQYIPRINIPQNNPNLITNMYKMFHSCDNVESGMVQFYNTVKDSPASHDGIFRYCGENTESGRQERAQLPSDWL